MTKKHKNMKELFIRELPINLFLNLDGKYINSPIVRNKSPHSYRRELRNIFRENSLLTTERKGRCDYCYHTKKGKKLANELAALMSDLYRIDYPVVHKD